MKFQSIMTKIQETHWTRINNYDVEISFNNNKFQAYCGYTATPDELNAAMISVSTPSYQASIITQYVGYEYRLGLGRPDIYRFTITFRDYDQMKLFNAFRNAFVASKDFYFNDIKMNITVNLDSDYGAEKKTPIFQTTTAIIENVSQLTFSHDTENQIAEFSVSFLCNTTELGGKSNLKYELPKDGLSSNNKQQQKQTT